MLFSKTMTCVMFAPSVSYSLFFTARNIQHIRSDHTGCIGHQSSFKCFSHTEVLVQKRRYVLLLKRRSILKIYPQRQWLADPQKQTRVSWKFNSEYVNVEDTVYCAGRRLSPPLHAPPLIIATAGKATPKSLSVINSNVFDWDPMNPTSNSLNV